MTHFLMILSSLLLLSCGNNDSVRKVQISDTAKVLKQAVTMGVDLRYMPSASSLKGRSHFEDTIVLTSPALPLAVLPHQIGKEKFKIMPQKELCEALSVDANLEALPTYLNVSRFDKNDSGYYIQLQSITCGKYASGGQLGIYFKKVKDSFVVVNRQSSSIN